MAGAASVAAKADKGLPVILARGWSIQQAEADPDGAWSAYWQSRADKQRDRLAKGLPPILPKGWTWEQGEANPAGIWEAFCKAQVGNGKAGVAAKGHIPFTEEEELLIQQGMEANGDWKEGWGGVSGRLPDLGQHRTRKQINNKRAHMAMALRKDKGMAGRKSWTEAELQQLKNCLTAEGQWKNGWGIRKSDRLGVPVIGTWSRGQILHKKKNLAYDMRAAMQSSTGTKKRKRSA